MCCPALCGYHAERALNCFLASLSTRVEKQATCLSDRGKTRGSQPSPPTLMNQPHSTGGKTPLVRTSNKCNTSWRLQITIFSEQSGEVIIFLDGKSFLSCCEQQHSYRLQFTERLRTVTEAHTPQLKSLLLQDWILARDLLQSITFSENKNCRTYSIRAVSQMGRGKGRKNTRRNCHDFNFLSIILPFHLFIMCQNSYFWHKPGKQVPNALYKCLNNIVLKF